MIPKRSAYQTLNATNYLENAIPDDAAGIRWLNDNVNGQPVVLEASGDSYKDYDNRVCNDRTVNGFRLVCA